MDETIPKDENLVLFASVHGMQYAGNARFLFEYVQKNRSDLRAFFYLRQKLNYGPTENVLRPGVGYIWKFLRAKVLFLTHGPDDFHPLYASSKKIVVHLWHGVPMRGLGLLDKSRTPKQRRNLSKTNQTISKVVMPSKESAMRWCSCVGIGLDKVLYAGQPRNDFLLNGEQPNLPESARLKIRTGSKIILYAPTWRPTGPVRWFPFEDFNPTELDAFLEANDMVILLRPHLTEKGTIQKYLTSRVVDFSADILNDVNLVLPYTDILITDYSSIFYDYLLLDRDLIFIHYDYEEFDAFYGFLFEDADFWFPGAKPKTFVDFKESLLCSGGNTEQRRRRNIVNQMINARQTSDSGKQIFEALGMSRNMS